MEMSLEVQKCRTWEEETYWKHFNSMHFCCLMPDDFHDHLVLPQKFAQNMIIELPNKVSLCGPSGAKWDVTLTKTNNNVAIAGDEWKEFVKAYALKVSHLLVFKYKRNVGFDVLILDPVSFCEEEASYFVKKHDKPTTITNNHDDREKKRSSTEAFSTELIEDNENNDDGFDFVVSKRARNDTKDLALMGETSNRKTPRKCSSSRLKRGGIRRWGKQRKGSIYVSHLKAKSIRTPKRNKASKEQPVVKNCEDNLELGRSHEPSEILGKMQNGNEGTQELISHESQEGVLEIVQFPTHNETEVGTTKKSKTGEEQHIVENRESDLDLGRSQESSEIRGNEVAEKRTSPESGEGNLETVESPNPNETAAGKKTNGSEPLKELTSPENGESTLKIIHPLKHYETRGKDRKRSEAAKEQQGTNVEIVYSLKSIEGIGNTPSEIEVSKEENSPEIEGRTPEFNACKSSGARGRPRKQSSPTSKNLVHENDEAATEQSGLDTKASNCSDKTRNTRSRSRRQIARSSPSKLKLESDSAMVFFAKEYVSNRRPVTEKEKANALRRAEQGLTDNSFIALMRPTTVYRKFYLHIPSDWTHKYLPHLNHNVVLRVGDKTWPAHFYYYTRKGAWLAGGGLKKFAFDNHLEEFDVCLVKLASEKGDAVTVFDVDIFRVIPEIVSPTLAVPF